MLIVKCSQKMAPVVYFKQCVALSKMATVTSMYMAWPLQLSRWRCQRDTIVPERNEHKNLAIANRSRVSCAHNTSRVSASLITPWPWKLS